MKKITSVLTTALAVFTLGIAGSTLAAGGGGKLDKQDWHFSGMTGRWDKNALARGFQVFKSSCAACHSLKYVAFRDFQAIGFTEAELKAIIAEDGYEVMGEPDEEGETEMRAARLSDYWPNPFPNPEAAAFNNYGKAPPDLSLMAKARPNGPDYIYSLLTGYVSPTKEHMEELHVAELNTDAGQNLNKAFPGHVLVMAPPLSGDDVEYLDGTPTTIEQEARDVTEFLMWTAEPKLVERKRMGIKVLIFLFIFSIFAYLMHRNVGHRAMDRQREEGGPWDH